MCKCRIGWPDSYWGYSDCFCQTLCVSDWKIIFLKYSPSFKFSISPSHFYDYETVTVHALLLPMHGHHLVALYVFLLREARGHKIVIASDTFRILRFLVMRNPHDQRSRLRFRIPALPPPQSRNAPKHEILNFETYGEMYRSLNHPLMSSLMNVNITSYRPSIIPWRVTLTGVLDIGVPSSLGRWPATCLRKFSTTSSVGFSTSPLISGYASHFTSTIVFGPLRRFSMMGYVVRAWRVFAVSFLRMGRRYRPIRRLISVVFAIFCRPTMTKCGMSKFCRRVSLLIIDWMKSNTIPNSLLLPYLDTGDSATPDISKDLWKINPVWR